MQSYEMLNMPNMLFQYMYFTTDKFIFKYLIRNVIEWYLSELYLMKTGTCFTLEKKSGMNGLE